MRRISVTGNQVALAGRKSSKLIDIFFPSALAAFAIVASVTDE
jgi:hypothetical protein